MQNNYLDISKDSDAMTLIRELLIEGVEVEYEPQKVEYEDTLPPELEGMLFIGEVGISTEYLFTERTGAGQRINDALMDDTYDGKAFVKLFEQPLINIWERQEAAEHELLELLGKLRGYWDAEGVWVDW